MSLALGTINVEYQTKIAKFVETLQSLSNFNIELISGRKYDRISINQSIRYFVEKSTGTIYGSKSRAAPNLNWWFGSLDTIQDWDWNGFHASPNRPGIATLVKSYDLYRHWRPAAENPFPVAEIDQVDK